MTHRARDRHRRSACDRKQRLRRIERPSLEELEIRTLLTATLSDIGVVGNVTGLNAAVEVVGNTTPPNVSGGYAFLLDSNGTLHNLGNLPGYSQTTATGISANGQVIGYSFASGSGSGLPVALAFLDVNGVMTPLGTLDNQGNEPESEPFGVNDTGQVVGWSRVYNNTDLHQDAFLYSGGQMTDLGTLGSATRPGSSKANAINDSGQIVGSTTVIDGSGDESQQAFLDMNGTMTALGIPFGQSSEATAINNSGQIVGNSGEANSGNLGQHAFLWSDGTATDLGTLPGDSYAVATSINDSGLIVGESFSNDPQTGHAFVYENGVMTDLNSLLPASSGFVLNTATGIDDADEICGLATYKNKVHGYVLTLSGSTTTPPGSGPTTIVVRSSSPASVYGQMIHLNAVVSPSPPGSGTPTGSVTFRDGSTTLGTVVLQDDQATLTLNNLLVGSYSITGIYSGDSQFTGSTSAVVNATVGPDATSLSLISSANTAAAGVPVTFTATLSPVAPGSGTPTGTVTFMDGMTVLGTASLSGGKATFTTSVLAPGSHSILVHYGGNGDFLAGNSAAFTLTVIAPNFPTQSVLKTSARSSTYGKPVTFTDIVKVLGSIRGTPTGDVMFMNDGKLLRTVPLKGGKAVLKTATLHLGQDKIQAVYSGGGKLGPSTSAILVENVAAARKKKPPAPRAILGMVESPASNRRASLSLK